MIRSQIRRLTTVGHSLFVLHLHPLLSSVAIETNWSFRPPCREQHAVQNSRDCRDGVRIANHSSQLPVRNVLRALDAGSRNAL